MSAGRVHSPRAVLQRALPRLPVRAADGAVQPILSHFGDDDEAATARRDEESGKGEKAAANGAWTHFTRQMAAIGPNIRAAVVQAVPPSVAALTRVRHFWLLLFACATLLWVARGLPATLTAAPLSVPPPRLHIDPLDALSDPGVIPRVADSASQPATAHDDPALREQRRAFLVARLAELRDSNEQRADDADDSSAVSTSTPAHISIGAPMRVIDNDGIVTAGTRGDSESSPVGSAAAARFSVPDDEFDLASALAFALPVTRDPRWTDRSSAEQLASVDMAEQEWRRSMDNRDGAATSSPLGAALRTLFTQTSCAPAPDARYLVVRCPAPGAPADAPFETELDHGMSPLLDWVRALAVAVSTSRTLLLDTSACDVATSASAGSARSTCCSMSHLFRPLSPCVIDFSHVDSASPAASQRMRRAADLFSGTASPLLDAHSSIPFAFHHANHACHLVHNLWEELPGAAKGKGGAHASVGAATMSRVQQVRMLARFALQPTAAYEAQLAHLVPALHEQLDVQVARAGMRPADADDQIDASLPPFLSLYVPHAVHINVSVQHLQNQHIPKQPRSATFTRAEGKGFRHGVHATDGAHPRGPLPSPLASKAVARFYPLEEFVDLVREQAATTGLRLVAVWAHDQGAGPSRESESDLARLETSDSAVVEELRRRLPHLIILDAHAIARSALSVSGIPGGTSASSKPPGKLASAVHTLFLLSSGSLVGGASSMVAVRLLSKLIPSPSAHLPLVDMDSDAGGVFLGCWESVFHALGRETIPGRVAPAPWGSALGRVIIPVVHRVGPAADAAVADASNLPPLSVRNMSGGAAHSVVAHRQLQGGASPRRVTLLLILGVRHSGSGQLGRYFDSRGLPVHKRLSALMSALTTYPQTLSDYSAAKEAFLTALGQEVEERLRPLSAAGERRPRTEADRMRSEEDRVWPPIAPKKDAAAAASAAEESEAQPEAQERVDFFSSFAAHTKFLEPGVAASDASGDDGSEGGALPSPAPAIRLEYGADFTDRRDKVMLHADVSLLLSILRDHGGSHLRGGALDLKVVVASRNVRDAALSGLKRSPPQMAAHLKAEWHFLYELRLQRDQTAAMDADLRSLPSSLFCVVGWRDLAEATLATAGKLQSFLGWEVREAPTAADPAVDPMLSEGVNVKYFAPESFRFGSGERPGKQVATASASASSSSAAAGGGSPYSLASDLASWYSSEGRALYQALSLPSPGGVVNLSQNEKNLLEDFFPPWPSKQAPSEQRHLAHLVHHSEARVKRGESEGLLRQERRAHAWIARQHQQQRQERSGAAAGDRSASLVAHARASSNLTILLESLQFPRDASGRALSCEDPSLRFLVFDGGLNASTLPRVYTDAQAGEESVRDLPLLDQCSLSGSYDLAAQIHSLARTLSVALLTGRTLVVPRVPNTIAALLDLAAVSFCTLEQVAGLGLRLERIPSGHVSLRGEPLRSHRAGQFFLVDGGTGSSAEALENAPLDLLSRDPFDTSQRVVSFAATEYSFHWLAYHAAEFQPGAPPSATSNSNSNSPGTAQARARKAFVPRVAGVQDYVASLVGFVVRPSSAMQQHQAALAAPLRREPASTPAAVPVLDVAILLPLQANDTALSAHALSTLLLRQFDVRGTWGAAGSAAADAPPVSIMVSFSCSRNSDLGSSHGGNNVNTGERSSEWRAFAAAVSHAADLASKDASVAANAAAWGREPLRPNTELQRQLLAHLLHGIDMRAEELGQALPSSSRVRLLTSRRTRGNYGPTAQQTSSSLFSSTHELLLADVLADVLQQSAARMAVSTHGHEEGLVVAELRHYAAMQHQAQTEHARRTSPAAAAPSLWGLRMASPLPSAPLFDILGGSYLGGLQRNEELVRQTALHAALYEPDVVAEVGKSVLVSAVADAKQCNPHLALPPSLLSAPPPPPILVAKKSFSSLVRFVLIAGMEGVGHHFFDNVLGATRTFNTSSPGAQRRMQQSAGISLEQKDKTPLSLMSLRYTGRIEAGQLRTDNHLSSFCYQLATHDSLAAYERSKRQVGIRLKWLLNLYTSGAGRPGADEPPRVVYINMLNSGGDGMHSYPNAEGQDRSMHHPDLVGLARAFEAHGADLRVLSLVRSPGAAFASTIRRGHGDGVKAHVGTDINTMFQARVLHDNVGILDSDLMALDPAFKLPLQLEELVRRPHVAARHIERHTGMRAGDVARALLHVSASFFVKPPSSWLLPFETEQIRVARDHFSHVGALAISDGLSYVDGPINWDARSSNAYVSANLRAAGHNPPAALANRQRPVEPPVNEDAQAADAYARALADVALVSPSPDQIDSDVLNRVCVSLSSLHPAGNQAERQTLPMRVSLRSMQGSGDSFLRWLLEQSTGVLSGSTDPHSLAPWPTSTFVPFTLVQQLGAWADAGQTSVQANATCVTCAYEISWDNAAHWRPEMYFFKKTPAQIQSRLAEDPLSPQAKAEAAAEAALAHAPPGSAAAASAAAATAAVQSASSSFVAPLGGQIVLLRNPLHIAFSIVQHLMSLHPFWSSADRLSAVDERNDEWSRRAILSARDTMMKEALTMVADAYPAFIESTGILPRGFAERAAMGALLDTDVFDKTPWGTANFAPARPSGSERDLPTYVLSAEELEAAPAEHLQSLLGFLGMEAVPRHWACLNGTLQRLANGATRPSPTQSGRVPNDVLLQFAASLLPSATRFTINNPWEWHLLLPRDEFAEFQRRLQPWTDFLGYSAAIAELRAQAEPRWQSEAEYLASKKSSGTDEPMPLQPSPPPTSSAVQQHMWERMTERGAKGRGGGGGRGGSGGGAASLPSHMLRQRQAAIDQQRNQHASAAAWRKKDKINLTRKQKLELQKQKKEAERAKKNRPSRP